MSLENIYFINGTAYAHTSETGEYNVANEVFNAIFNINVVELLETTNKGEFLLEKVKDIKMGDVADLVVKGIETDGENWRINGEFIPYVAGDILFVTVGEIVDITKAEDKLEAAVRTLLGRRTIGKHFANFSTKLKDNLAKLRDTNTADFILGLFDAENKLKYLASYN